jgi:hypothetical protein
VVVGLTVIEFVVDELFAHEYVPPAGLGVAFIVADKPAQIVSEETVTVGIGLTVTTPVPVAIHPFKEYNTV